VSSRPKRLASRPGSTSFLTDHSVFESSEAFKTGNQLGCSRPIRLAEQADIRVNGLTEDTDRNQCQRRIEVSTLNEMRGHFRSLPAQTGLTPKSKRGLTVTSLCWR
jgi:hypothetical protein